MRDLALNFPYLCSVWIIHESQSFVVGVSAWWVGVGVVGAREKIIQFSIQLHLLCVDGATVRSLLPRSYNDQARRMTRKDI